MFSSNRRGGFPAISASVQRLLHVPFSERPFHFAVEISTLKIPQCRFHAPLRPSCHNIARYLNPPEIELLHFAIIVYIAASLEVFTQSPFHRRASTGQLIPGMSPFSPAS